MRVCVGSQSVPLKWNEKGLRQVSVFRVLLCYPAAIVLKLLMTHQSTPLVQRRPLVTADPGPSHGPESKLELGSHQQQISTPDAKLPESTRQDPGLPFDDTSLNAPINDPVGPIFLGNDAESPSNVPASNTEPADSHVSSPSNDAISMEDPPSGDNNSPSNDPISYQGPPNL